MRSPNRPLQPRLDEGLVEQLAILDLGIAIGAAIARTCRVDVEAQRLAVAHVVGRIEVHQDGTLSIVTARGLPFTAGHGQQAGHVLVEGGVAPEVDDAMVGLPEALPDRVATTVVVEGLGAEPAPAAQALGEDELPEGRGVGGMQTPARSEAGPAARPACPSRAWPTKSGRRISPKQAACLTWRR